MLDQPSWHVEWHESWDYRFQPVGWVANIYTDASVTAVVLVEPVADTSSAI